MPNPIVVPWEEFIKPLEIVSRIRVVDRSLNPEVLIDLFSELERLEIAVHRIYLNSLAFADVRKWSHNIVAMELSPDEMHKGNLAKSWGATYVVSNTVPKDTVLICDEKFTKAAILEVKSDIPYATDLLIMHDKLCSIMAQTQSLLAQSTSLVKELVRVVERTQQPK